MEFAKKCGATHTLLVGRDDSEEGVATRVLDILGAMPDRTVECSGAQFAVNLAVHVSDPYKMRRVRILPDFLNVIDA